MLTVKKAWQDDEVFVHTIRGGKATKNTWEIMEYCRLNKAYVLRSVDDTSDFRYLKGDKLVAIANY